MSYLDMLCREIGPSYALIVDADGEPVEAVPFERPAAITVSRVDPWSELFRAAAREDAGRLLAVRSEAR